MRLFSLTSIASWDGICGQSLTCLLSAWIPNTELTPLDVDSETTKNPIEKGKSKTLLAAYGKAAENNDLAHFKTMLADHQKAIEIDEEIKEEKAANKTKKSSRKSGDAAPAADDADEMELDDETAAEKPKSKKRKKDDSDDGDEKVRTCMTIAIRYSLTGLSLRRLLRQQPS